MKRLTRQEVRETVYNTPRWKALRLQTLNIQPICPCGRLATMVHHVQPIRDGGDPWDRDNLKSLCAKCHNAEHAGPRQPEVLAWTQAVIDLLS